MSSLLSHDGLDVTITDGNPTPGDPDVDQVRLSATTSVLTKFPRGFPDFSEIEEDSITWTAVNDADGVVIHARLIGEGWAPSTVNGSDPPALTGSTVTWGPFDVTAGGQVTIDFAPIAQPVADGTAAWNGVQLDQTAGDPLTLWGFAVSDPALRPAQTVSYDDTLPEPSGMSPAGGRIVSIPQPPIRIRDFAVELADMVLDQVQLQYWNTDPGSDLSTPDGTLTQTTTEPTVVTAGTAFNLTHFDLDPLTYYRARLKPQGGPWTPWTPLESCGYHALPTVTPDDDPVELVPNPLRTWTLESGTQTMYRLTRSRLETPDVPLDPDQVPVATSTTAGYVVGDHAEVLDFRSYVDTIEVWDDLDREAVPGGPDHTTVEFVWSLVSDKRLEAPTMGDVDQLGGATPFPRVQWISPNIGDTFKVRRAKVTDGIAGDWFAVSPELDGVDVVIADNGESGYVFQYVDYRAAGGTHYRYYVERITDHRGSARSDSVDIITETRWVYLACPTTGQKWLRLMEADIGSWVHDEPTAASYAPQRGDGYYRRQKGDRLAVSTTVTGQIWAVTDLENPQDYLTAEDQRQAFYQMTVTDDPVYLVTPHEVIEVTIGETAMTPLDDEYDLPYLLEFSVWQTGPGTLTSSEFLDLGQVSTVLVDFESWSEGQTITSADPSGVITGCAGTVQARGSAAAHGVMGARLYDVSGGSNVHLLVDAENNAVGAYFPHGYPDQVGDHNVLKWDKVGGGQVAAIHREQNGAFDIRDPDGDRQPGWSSFHAADDQPFAIIGDILWDAGTLYVRGKVWIGDNLEGTRPDVVIKAEVDCPVAPLPGVRVGPTQTFGGGNIDVDSIRVVDSSSADLPPLGVPAFTGTVSWANASTMDHTTVYSRALGITGTEQVRLAYSTTANGDGTPASPTLGALADVDEYGTAGMYATGLTGGTRYYYAVADADGNIIGGVGQIKTLPTPGTHAVLKIGHWSCQDGNPTGDPLAWPALEAELCDILIEQGDSHGYPGGTFKPTTPLERMLAHYEAMQLKLPPMRSCLTKSSVEAQISDHEGAGNGQYVNPDTGLYDWPGQLAIWRTQIDTFAKARPVIYSDTRTEPRSRDYCKPLVKNRAGATSVMLHVFDNRGLDRSDGTDPDGPDKTFIGTEQWNRFLANKLGATQGLNLVAFEGNWLATPNENAIDKWWAFNWEQVNRIAPVFAGIQVLALVGDRHIGGYLHKSKNPLGSFTVCCASAMEMHGLSLQPGEIFKDSTNTTRVFGNVNVPGTPNRQYGILVVDDDPATKVIGTDWTFKDAITATAPFGTFHEDFSYV